MPTATLTRALASGLLALVAATGAPAAQMPVEDAVVVASSVVLPPPHVVERSAGAYDPTSWRSPYPARIDRERAWRRDEGKRRAWERREWERRQWERRQWERREWARREAWRHRWAHP